MFGINKSYVLLCGSVTQDVALLRPAELSGTSG